MLRFLTVFLLLVSPATAQTFVVDSSDPAADYQSLLTAIASVPAGSVLLVRSDFSESGGDVLYQIDKDLTLVGDGPGSGRVTVFGELWVAFTGGPSHVAMTRVSWDSSLRTSPIGTVVQWGLGSYLHLDQADLRTTAVAGIATRGAPSGGIQVLTSCNVYGGELSFSPIEQASDNATMIVKDCTVTHLLGPPEDAIIVERGRVFSSNTTYHGDVFVPPNGTFYNLPDTLNLQEWNLRLGGFVTLEATGIPFGPSILFLSSSFPQQGVATGSGFWFLGGGLTSVVLLYDATGHWQASGTIPSNPALLGTPISLQVLDVLTNQLSPPEVGIVGS